MANPGYGQRLIAARRALGLSQEDLAAAVDCTQASISRYESEKSRPMRKTWQALCAVLRADELQLRWNGVAPEPRVSRKVNIYDVPSSAVREVSQEEYLNWKASRRR